jgi:cephalosporin hydroxylase
MKLTIDTSAGTLTQESGSEQKTVGLYTREAFELISLQWVKLGWNQKYPYIFSWFGRPIIQLPEDMIRLQEVIYRLQPDVIVETGIAHGGSLVFNASLCKAIGKGRVIGIDIEIRPANRSAIEAHPLAPSIAMVEGSSIDPEIIRRVHALVEPGETVLVLLDSNHSRAHVLAELEAYCDLVSEGSYIVATDGVMKDLGDVPRGKPEWAWDNPTSAAAAFAAAHPEFVIDPPAWPFNESPLVEDVTHWPGGWLRRLEIRTGQ